MTTTQPTLDYVHAPLLAHAQSTPEHPFLLAGDGVSYAQAQQWIAQCIEHLQGHKRVAVWMNKGNDYALSVLSCLYVGAVYVPIDGKQPLARVMDILEDCQAEVLITDDPHADQFAGARLEMSLVKVLVTEVPKTCNTDLFPGLEVVKFYPTEEIDGSLPLSCHPTTMDSVAAILYTSGSTGKPKGVQLSHRNLANFITWCDDELSVRSVDRFLNTASFNFDLSTFDLFLTLRAGAAAYFTGDHESQNLARLATVIQDHQISVMYTVPSLLALMNRADIWSIADSSHFRYVVFAGEVMPMPHLRSLIDALPSSCQTYNFYGPTETNVCLYHKVTETDLPSDKPLPIGKPIANTQVWLTDSEGEPLPEDSNESGEICVSGYCVTPGYWNRSGDRNTENHSRGVHATGDLGHWKHQVFVYQGRIDRMVKINGYRVELGEIESALVSHPDIEEVAVAVTEQGVKKIKAFVSFTDANKRLTVTQIKDYCATRLPAYMVPNSVSILIALPKNANGKTDYRKLMEKPLTAA